MTSVTGGSVDRAGAAAGDYAGWALAGATIFFGAFFLFEVEPLIAKAIISHASTMTARTVGTAL